MYSYELIAVAIQVDEEGASEEKPIFTYRIKVKHGVIIARNSSAEKPDYLVSQFDSEASFEILYINLNAIYKCSIEIRQHKRRI